MERRYIIGMEHYWRWAAFFFSFLLSFLSWLRDWKFFKNLCSTCRANILRLSAPFAITRTLILTPLSCPVLSHPSPSHPVPSFWRKPFLWARLECSAQWKFWFYASRPAGGGGVSLAHGTSCRPPFTASTDTPEKNKEEVDQISSSLPNGTVYGDKSGGRSQVLRCLFLGNTEKYSA